MSRVLADSPRISEETKRRVRQAMEELNYHPNALARGLVTNSSQTLGVLIPPGFSEFFENPFFAEMMRGVADVAAAEGFDLALSTSARSEEEMLERMIRGRRVDGILLLGSRMVDPAIRTVVREGFPATLLGRPAEPVPLCWVNNDNVAAAREATEHLLKLGHRRIGFLGGSSDWVVTHDRLAGYRQALEAAGVAPDPMLEVCSFFLEQGGYLGMMRLLALSDRPTAVLASDDVLAFGAMRAAGELGYAIPDDLAIIGFNDIRLAEIAYPALTSVRVHMRELGVESARLLIRQVRGEISSPEHVVVRHELVVRHSCGARRRMRP